MSIRQALAPRVRDTHVVFRLSDPMLELRAVKLVQELRRPRVGPSFKRRAGVWETRFPRLDVDRMEYLFEVVHAHGTTEQICDPGNPKLAPGPFADRSVIEFPGYRPPAWIVNSEAGTSVDVEIDSRALRRSVKASLWTSPGGRAGDRLPLLVAHDGGDYRHYSLLLVFLYDAVRAGRLPAMRAALLHPEVRDEEYSASAVYARALAHDILPALAARAPLAPGRAARVGMGASLGALALLHAHRSHPATFGGLYLQSGSYFRRRFDKHELGFPRFGRISRFMGRVLASDAYPHAVPVTMTCGIAEENLANNRAAATALQSQGYDVAFVTNRDAHNWVAWRDTFEPHLVDLLARLWT